MNDAADNEIFIASLRVAEELVLLWFVLSNCNLNSTMVEKSSRNLSYMSRKQSQGALLFSSHLSLYKRPSLFAIYISCIVLIEYVSHH